MPEQATAPTPTLSDPAASADDAARAAEPTEAELAAQLDAADDAWFDQHIPEDDDAAEAGATAAEAAGGSAAEQAQAPAEETQAAPELTDAQRELLAERLGADALEDLPPEVAVKLAERYAAAAPTPTPTTQADARDDKDKAGEPPAPEPDEALEGMQGDLHEILGEDLGGKLSGYLGGLSQRLAAFEKKLAGAGGGGVPEELQQAFGQLGGMVLEMRAEQARSRLVAEIPQLADDATFRRVYERALTLDPAPYEKRGGGPAMLPEILRDAAALELSRELLRDRQERDERLALARANGSPASPARQQPARPTNEDPDDVYLRVYEETGDTAKAKQAYEEARARRPE